MTQTIERLITVHDCAPPHADFRAEVLAGLRRFPKQLPCKFLYDDRGSHLFEQICELDEYYPTRTELHIMRRHAPEIASLLGPRVLLLEFGSGSSIKTRILLDHLIDPAAYVPIDISRAPLIHAARALAAAYPSLDILPVCADYTASFTTPPTSRHASRTIIYFPGSTIGNFEPRPAKQFLSRARILCGPGGGMLIGVDLKKDPSLLHSAYNDPSGLTASFNRNVLVRINRELSANFHPDRFAHYAPYNPRRGRVEMHLVSLHPHSVQVADEPFHFNAGETIHTENSYKYSLPHFYHLATNSGFQPAMTWTDDHHLFSVHYLLAR